MKKRIFWLCAVFSALLICGGTALTSAQPGDNSDPVVTKSYIDQAISELKTYIDQKGGDDSAPAASGVSSSYQVMNISAGQSVTMGEGTEFILRAGRGRVFSTERGGIADTTAGADLADGASVPANHLLIVPRADGRGYEASADSVLMVRGSYRIE